MKEIKPIDHRIIAFLKSQTNLTLAVSENNLPWCANCFYAFEEENNYLFFKSKSSSIHVSIGLKNNAVAGTILPDSLDKKRICGIQFTGKMSAPSGDFILLARKVYYAKHPVAMIMPGELWAIKLQSIKFTDNKFGFGKRFLWVRDSVGEMDSKPS